MLVFTDLTSHTVKAPHLGNALLLSQDHSPNTARDSREGSSPEISRRLHFAHCVQSEITARSNPLQQHIPKTQSSKSQSKALNPSPKSYQGSVLAGREWQIKGERIGAQQHQRVKSAWFLIALALCLSSPAPIHEHNVFCSLRTRTDAALVHLFHPFFSAGLFAFIPSALPPSFPSFSSARTHWLCIRPSFFQWARMPDMALSGCVYPPPSPSFPHCSLLSQGGGGRFSPSPFPLLFVYCMSLQLKSETTMWIYKKRW